jgi:phosphatidylglycerophosphatase A
VADVVKIPPASDAERLRGGLGVMTDDVVAGVYAHFALRAILAIFRI